MKLAVSPQILALCTAFAWGVGGFFEKRGLLLGDLSPQIGITIRTAVALLILAAVSFPQWKTLLSAAPRVWLYMILGGGVLAGAIGMLCFYAAIKGAHLSRVMPIAFTSPLFGALMGILFASEPVTPKTAIGMALTVGGIVVLSV
jgi:transporter family protein